MSAHQTVVDAVAFLPPGTRVLHASCLLPEGAAHGHGHGMGTPKAEARRHLALVLWRALHAAGGGMASPPPVADPIDLREDGLGRPRIPDGPSISFSQNGMRLHGAACLPGHDVGIDAAPPQDFPPSYPYARAFAEDELAWAVPRCGGDRAWAAAMLWTAKEAAVKCLGCGFHLFGPGEVVVIPAPAPPGAGLSFRIAWRNRAATAVGDSKPQGCLTRTADGMLALVVVPRQAGR